ncbi:hypothetical protein GUJ93_ZPchr0001g29492 [Zizania palustris]|uniref:Uncharacterized protein n=1 Tax=Zizania palustris TaxID=103762 RepID=A0A8J5RZ28_ZIZPA|nr:hypothetical protein GUJ93_ZPchr0001g29492 [Zizania palustris]
MFLSVSQHRSLWIVWSRWQQHEVSRFSEKIVRLGRIRSVHVDDPGSVAAARERAPARGECVLGACLAWPKRMVASSAHGLAATSDASLAHISSLSSSSVQAPGLGPKLFALRIHLGAGSRSGKESSSNLSCAGTMSLACLVCHGMSSPSHSFRSYSVSSSDEENRCGSVVACLTRRVIPAGTANSVGTSKVTPFPLMAAGQGTEGAPRLQRSRAVSRDLVRDWNFEEIVVGN